ncbi:MAG: two-component regulator propeller domain-containing protein [Bacteroidales bacterium]|nr:two-component regulator propeller domain-containing protein [Bacteroidales bacterium]
MNCKKILFSILLLLVSVMAEAQVNMLFTSDSDLPNSLINKIVEDKEGIVWVATEDGLCKYNGSRFISYYHEEGNPHSLVSNFVRTLAVDQENRLFVGTIQGVQMYRPATDDFSLPAAAPDQEIYPENITDLTLLSSGKLVVSGHTSYVISVNDKGEMEVSNMLFSQKLGSFFRCAEDAQGALWILKQNEDLYRISAQGSLYCLRDASNQRYMLSTLCLGPDGKMYAGCGNAGLLRFNDQTQVFDTIATECQPFFVRDLQTLNETPFICIGTDGQGMKFLHCPSGTITDFLFNYPFVDPAVQKVHTIAVSRNHDIWMGLYQKGVMLTTPTPAQFRYMGVKSGSSNFIGDRCVTTLLETHDGNIWVGTDNGGLHGITPQGEKIASYHGDGTNRTVPNAFMTLFEDSKKRVWFGSFHQGLGWVNLSNGQCRYLPVQGKDASTVNVYAFTEDREGTVWVASMGNGVMRFNERLQSLEPITSSHGVSNWSTDILYNENDNKLYVGTYNGLCIFDLNTDDFAQQTVLSQHVVNDLCLFAPNQLCLCTNRGFVIYNCITQEVQELTKKEGLPASCSYAALPDDEGNLWISSNQGLTKYNVARNTFNNYGVQDGLQGNEFYKKSSMRDASGQLWFGGINGITWFDPKNISIRSQKCEARVVALYTDQRQVLPETDGSFKLTDQDHSFTIEFATRPLSYTRRVIYQASLDEERWQSLPPLSNRITLSNLSAGSHTLQFKAVCDGIDSEISSINVHIAYPWYMRWWALLIWLWLLGTISYLSFLQIRRRHHIRQHIKQHKQAQAVTEAKLQFFMQTAATQEVFKAKTPKNGHKILLVDNDNKTRNYIEQELSSSYKVVACSNGTEALRELALQKFDIMITDLILPMIDGIELCTQVRRNINLNQLTIVMLTARSTDEDRIASLNLGVDVFMTKPFNIEVLKSTVQNLLKGQDRLRNSLSGRDRQADKIETPKVTTHDEKLLARVTRVVEEHLKDTNLNSDMIASEVGISRVHLFRKLKELTGQTTREFYRNVRLTKAAELLAEKKLTIGEVAVQVGFSNQHNFSKAFKEMYGMPPAEYMQLHRQEMKATK